MWILIGKKRPKWLETVIVTVEHQHRWVSLMWAGRDKRWHYADNGERVPTEYKVIAWQALPKTYKS